MTAVNVSVNWNIPEEDSENNFTNKKFQILKPYVVKNTVSNEMFVAIKVHCSYDPKHQREYTVFLIQGHQFLWASQPENLTVISQAEAEVNFTVKNPK